METNLENYAAEMSRKIKALGLDSYHWSEVALVIDELLKHADFRSEHKKEGLCFIGFTNGTQISYAMESDGEGVFYNDSKNECYIPVYMLKSHLHRIETTSGGAVTAESIGIK